MSMTKTTRINKTKLFEVLGYAPHPGQLLVHNSTAPRRILACGVRWGKTLCAAMEGLAAALQPCERSVGWLAAPTYELADRAFKEIEIRVLRHQQHRVLEHRPSEHALVLRNLGGGKSEIRTKSADNPVSLLGEGLDWLVVDEAARLKADIWRAHLSQRLIDRNGWALLLSTPRGCDWFYRLYRKGQNGVAGFESWTSPSWGNPNLNRAVIELERGSLSHDDYSQEYLAQFVGESLEPCDSCGGPSTAASGLFVQVGDFELPTCVDCGLPIDERGRTLVYRARNGAPYFKLIKLQGTPPGRFVLPPVGAHLSRLEQLRQDGADSASSAINSGEPPKDPGAPPPGFRELRPWVEPRDIRSTGRIDGSDVRDAPDAQALGEHR